LSLFIFTNFSGNIFNKIEQSPSFRIIVSLVEHLSVIHTATPDSVYYDALHEFLVIIYLRIFMWKLSGKKSILMTEKNRRIKLNTSWGVGL
jgi:hypothetical protein